MKICTKCGETKARSEFHKNPTKKDGLQDRCKECRKLYHKQHYLNNQDTYKSNARKNEKKSRGYITDIKKKSKCIKCGDKRWYVLDFHHREKKNFEIGGAGKGKSIKTIRKEINKCDVLCANCHRELHYLENAGNA